jgi:hypothetical protein
MKRLIPLIAAIALLASACLIHSPRTLQPQSIFGVNCEAEWNEQTYVAGVPTEQGGDLVVGWLEVNPNKSSDCVFLHVCMTWVDLVTGTQLACSPIVTPALSEYSTSVVAVPSEPGATVRSTDAQLTMAWDNPGGGDITVCWIHKEDVNDPDCPPLLPTE